MFGKAQFASRRHGFVIAASAWNVWRNTTGYEWYAAAMVTVAEAKLGIGYERTSRQKVRLPDDRVVVSYISDIASSPLALAIREHILDEIHDGAWLGGRIGAGAEVLYFVFFWLRGRHLGRKRRIRGGELVTARQLRRRVSFAIRSAVNHISRKSR